MKMSSLVGRFLTLIAFVVSLIFLTAVASAQLTTSEWSTLWGGIDEAIQEVATDPLTAHVTTEIARAIEARPILPEPNIDPELVTFRMNFRRAGTGQDTYSIVVTPDPGHALIQCAWFADSDESGRLYPGNRSAFYDAGRGGGPALSADCYAIGPYYTGEHHGLRP